jgi:hypothetical protein
VLIATDRFRSVLEGTRTFVDIDDLCWAEVGHPIGSLGLDELRDRARSAADQFERIVLAQPSVRHQDRG